MEERSVRAPIDGVGSDEWLPSDSDTTPSGLYFRVFKPLVDRLLGLILLVLSLPIVAVASILIRVRLGPPIFYTQDRVGKDGRQFKLYKLRTMIPDRRVQLNGYRGPERRKTHKSPDDPRVTPLGRALRAFRLDELPQFLNVVKGDMSLVGPRPELPEIVSGYEPWQHQRHFIKPGVTGPWQISNRNGDLMCEHTDIDIAYLNEMSLWRDFAILAATPKAMLGRRKGY